MQEVSADIFVTLDHLIARLAPIAHQVTVGDVIFILGQIFSTCVLSYLVIAIPISFIKFVKRIFF